MLFRNVRKENIPQMVFISKVAFPEMEMGHYTDFIHFIEKYLVKWPFIIEIDNKAVGYTCARPWNKNMIKDDFYKPSPIYASKEYPAIINVEVLADFESQGIGSNKVNMMIVQAQNHNFRSVILSYREEKQSYYRKSGFQLQGKSLYHYRVLGMK